MHKPTKVYAVEGDSANRKKIPTEPQINSQMICPKSMQYYYILNVIYTILIINSPQSTDETQIFRLPYAD